MSYFQKALLALLFIPAFLKAQNNFHKGYVLSLSGDTIKGSIDFKEWYANPKQIKFKAEGSTAVTLYTPANAGGFGVTGYDDYKRFVVPIAQDKIAMSELTHSIDTTVIIDTVFLRTLTTGKHVNLYSYIDKKEELFIQDGNAQPVSLTRHLYLVGDNMVATDNRYVSQLTKLARIYQPNNEKLFRDIERTGYYASDISKLVYRINGAQAIIKADEAMHIPNRFYIGGGVDIASFKMYETNTSMTDWGSASVQPMINLGYDIYLRNHIGKFILRTELNFSSVKGDIDRNFPAWTQNENFKFTQYVFAINPQLIFNVYNSKNFKFYIDAGLAYNFCSYSNKQYTPPTIYLADKLASNYPNIFPYTNSGYLVLTTKTGIVLNDRIELFAGYNPYNNILSDNINYQLMANHYRVGINLLLGKKVE